MSDIEETNTDLAASDPDGAGMDEDMQEPEGEYDGEHAKVLGHTIPRPTTVLEAAPQGEIGKFVVTLLDELSSAPVLEDVERINKGATTEARTPLMAVIVAVLARNGGTMLIEELATQIGPYWNRPLPSSPYDLEEFVYVIVRNADNIRVQEQF